jgi:hypothetical protein
MQYELCGDTFVTVLQLKPERDEIPWNIYSYMGDNLKRTIPVIEH